MVKANHPLAETDYHLVVKDQRSIDGDTKLNTKMAFIAALIRLATGN